MKKVTPSNEWMGKKPGPSYVWVWKHCNYSSGTIKLAVCTKWCADNTESPVHTLSGTMNGERSAGVIETIRITQTTAKTSNGRTSCASQIPRETDRSKTAKRKAAKVPKRGKHFPSLTKCRDLSNSQYNIYMKERTTNEHTRTHSEHTHTHAHSCETKKDSSHMCRYGAAAAGKNSFFFYFSTRFVRFHNWNAHIRVSVSLNTHAPFFTSALGRSLLLLPSSASESRCLSYIA